MFTPQELQALSALLQRVDLKGNEAMTVALLQQKIATLLPKEVKVEDKEKKTKKD